MTPLRVIVADDERPARAFLSGMLQRFEDVELVGEAGSGAEAVELIEQLSPDLALLDLQMPEVDGMGVVRLLRRDRLPLIAFVTAYDEYAVRAFEMNAVDYLLKPVDPARLRSTVNRRAGATRARRSAAGRCGPPAHRRQRIRGVRSHTRCCGEFRFGSAKTSISFPSIRSSRSSPTVSCFTS